jgi:hypothetical protein
MTDNLQKPQNVASDVTTPDPNPTPELDDWKSIYEMNAAELGDKIDLFQQMLPLLHSDIARGRVTDGIEWMTARRAALGGAAQ